MMGMQVVTVFGSAQVEPGSASYEQARVAGRLLAEAGLTVCSGGYGGVMEAVSRGAKDAGGMAIGVPSRLFAGRIPNRWLERVVWTESLPERLQTMVAMGQAYLGLHGGIGTLTEISLTWSLLQTHAIPPRPLVLLRHPWLGLLDFCQAELIIHPPDFSCVQTANNVEDAVQVVAESLRTRGE
jgi:uncharacterized protein (TIGR00730 family)